MPKVWPHRHLCSLCTAQKHPGHIVKPVSLCSPLAEGRGTAKGCFLLNPSTTTRGAFSYFSSKFWGEKPNRLGNLHILSIKHVVSAWTPSTLETGRLSMQGAHCLPLTITLSVISRLPVTCLPQHHMSPAPPGLGQAMLPSQPLTVELSLTNTVYETARLPDGQLLPPFDGLRRADRDESGIL